MSTHTISVTSTSRFHVTDETRYQEIMRQLLVLGENEKVIGIPKDISISISTDEVLHGFLCTGELGFTGDAEITDKKSFIKELQGILLDTDNVILTEMSCHSDGVMRNDVICITKDECVHKDLLDFQNLVKEEAEERQSYSFHPNFQIPESATEHQRVLLELSFKYRDTPMIKVYQVGFGWDCYIGTEVDPYTEALLKEFVRYYENGDVIRHPMFNEIAPINKPDVNVFPNLLGRTKETFAKPFVIRNENILHEIWWALKIETFDLSDVEGFGDFDNYVTKYQNNLEKSWGKYMKEAAC